MQNSTKTRSIVYVSGTRADYGLMMGTLQEIQADEGLDLGILATGMHLSNEFGETIREIQKDGFNVICEVPILSAEDTGKGMGKSVGLGIIGMCDQFDIFKPDIVLLEGDRGESLAAAIAAAHMNIAVAHISGGDVTGTTIDESIRHAISKFAHIHFPGTETSANRLVKLGEDPWRIHMVGTPGCDLSKESYTPKDEIAGLLDLNIDEPIIVVLQHPVTTQTTLAAYQMRETMEALLSLNQQTIIIYPNADAGGRDMIEVIEEYTHYANIRSVKNLPRHMYVGLLRIAAVLVGNSSSALVEAPDLGLPAVNIGTRQQGRERGGNLIDANSDRNDITEAVYHVMALRESPSAKRKWSSTPYKDDYTATKITGILSSTELSSSLLQKKFYDGDKTLGTA